MTLFSDVIYVPRYIQDFSEASANYFNARRIGRTSWYAATEVVKCPISVYRMVRRFVMQLKDATKEFESVGNQGA